jgi:hypothetical protein
MQLVVEVEYVPEEAELDGSMYEEFRKIFDRFNFHETAGTQVKCSFFLLCNFILFILIVC